MSNDGVSGSFAALADQRSNNERDTGTNEPSGKVHVDGNRNGKSNEFVHKDDTPGIEVESTSGNTDTHVSDSYVNVESSNQEKPISLDTTVGGNVDVNEAPVADGGPNNSGPSPPATYDQYPSNPFNTINKPPSSPTIASKIHRRNSADYTQTSHFLKACHLCKRRLITGRDIFMYRYYSNLE
ncbi:hypothetical protein CTI12_AA511850 [Artemisia annua]|uniref:FLZ-type domain-containing protein n=1 Tax=Artemisia annua TaxID=35608 RepID=A0A2U1LAX9_ARTAN|nr:hypothetical protein CTI12_AA511850 [Artemisia annua]